ncbi:NADPH-dependent FMN reductase [Guptibacillus algicola]|uniref:NADPH-dependent FMN reductase n=1 Tax=Guptibacillus algicola TaxID=225844 RepID=UPI001CD4BFCC|nr:NADPH-dependent FMN reductase [Alkalihalobacillus algicola]MCA0989615.1 NADPH-dependent FMN reductase [Alkalihalobacillus algicola]
MSNVVLIYGGNSLQSRLKGIKDYAESYLDEQSISYESINVIDLPSTDLITANFNSPEILEANEKVEKAYAVIILTPVYKASYTGILKTYLDLLPQKALKGKVVLPLMIGGSFGHLLAIDYALKPVLSSLGATNLLSGAYVIDQHVQRGEGNTFVLDEEAKKRLRGNLETLEEELKK